nr:hypothetical protein [Tanacetum cinerariifolium]
MKDDTERRFGNVDDTTKVNSPFSRQSPRSQHFNPSNEDMRHTRDEITFTHASGSYNLLLFQVGLALLLGVHIVKPFLGIDILRWYEALNEDYKELYQSHRSCQCLPDRLTETQNQLLDIVQIWNQLIKDHTTLQQKSLSDVFNLAIAAGWSEGVKEAFSEEESEAFLASAADYDPACKNTFMSEFDSLFNKSYPYVEKLAESFRLPLGD